MSSDQQVQCSWANIMLQFTGNVENKLRGGLRQFVDIKLTMVEGK